MEMEEDVNQNCGQRSRVKENVGGVTFVEPPPQEAKNHPPVLWRLRSRKCPSSLSFLRIGW